MHRRTGVAALVLAVATMLAGCATTQSSLVDGSSIGVGLDVPYTGAGPAAPASTAADLAVGAATLSGFSYLDADGERVADGTFGTIERLAESPLKVRYTVADGITWSDGVGIDGVDLLLDWAARAHPFPGTRFGSLPDFALSGAKEVRLSEDRKSVTIVYDREDADWSDAFRAPLPAHAIAMRAFGSASPEAAKDDVIVAIDAARQGDVARLAELATAWSSAFALDEEPPPSSGPYRLVSAGAEAVELAANPRYEGARSPSFASLSIRFAADPAALVQALSIGVLDIVQVTWNDALRTVLARIGADRADLPSTAAPSVLVGWFHREIDHVKPARSDLGALWNPWAWSPNVLTAD